MREKIEARIKELEKQRDEFITQANQNIAALNGAINELKRLIEDENDEDNGR